MGAGRVDCQSMFGLASYLNLGQVTDAACVSIALRFPFFMGQTASLGNLCPAESFQSASNVQDNESASPVDKQLPWLKGNCAKQCSHLQFCCIKLLLNNANGSKQFYCLSLGSLVNTLVFLKKEFADC